MNTIFWVRHGENLANITKEFSYKHTDYSLTAKGKMQAQQTARYFRENAIAHIVSSPLKRAHETADILSHELGLPVTILEEFRELNVGELELQPVSRELWEQYHSVLEDWTNGKPDSGFPGGENYHQALARTQQGLAKVLDGPTGIRAIVVGHGGIMLSTIFDICPDADREMIRRTESHNCSVSELHFPEGSLTARLIAWADASHLHGEAADLVSGTPEC